MGQYTYHGLELITTQEKLKHDNNEKTWHFYLRGLIYYN